MLVLSRKTNEQIVIDGNVVVTIVEIRGDKVRLGIEAPSDITVHRKEVFEAIRRQQSLGSSPSTATSSAPVSGSAPTVPIPASLPLSEPLSDRSIPAAPKPSGD